jgi:glutamate synthase (NADPH/NADH) small chain
MIGRLQRYAMDHVYNRDIDVFQPAAPSGKRVAVIGAGPAGLSCAGELAKAGHNVTIFEKRPLGGGLSTYGIIVLREPVDIALAEVKMILRLGVHLKTNIELGRNLTLADLQASFDAVFLGVGLGSTPALAIPGEEHCIDGLEYIERSKMDPRNLKIGRRVVVIGAGNTAIDCATIAKRLGAESVTILYRRTEREMPAYEHEYEFIKNEGVEFRFLTQPVRAIVVDGRPTGIECVQMRLGDLDASERPRAVPVPGSEFTIDADQIVKAIGQEKLGLASLLGLQTENGYIEINSALETSLPGVYAGGDCIRSKGAASTVMAVEDGKLAAQSIHCRLLSAAASNGTRKYG